MTTATNAQDVVAVLREDFSQVFTEARTIKATVMRDSKAMEHPLETGATVTDHRIILPVSVELSLILSSANYPDVYQQIADLFTRGELLSVQTRVDTYASLFIEKMPHDETPDMMDGVVVALSLKEAQFVEATYSALATSPSSGMKAGKTVKNPKDGTTKQRGQQQPKEPPPARKKSLLVDIFGG